jgi:prepilin-type N-terminal cleavage/methylation domain-containing protein
VKRSGFTLLEVLIAMATGLVVFGLTASLLRSAVLSFGRAEERFDPRERALLAFAMFRAAVADAWQVGPSADGLGLTFSGPRGTGEISLGRSQRAIVLRLPGQRSTTPLIASGVQEFRAGWVHSRLLRVAVRIQRTSSSRLQPLDDLVVSDEIHVPAVGLPPFDMPWNPTPVELEHEHRPAR